MSHKIAKRIRKALKAEGVDVTHALYEWSNSTNKGNGGLILADSGRKAYKLAKKAYKG